MRGKTVIAIAHRLSTIRSADQILVLEDGQVVERGSHAQLMALGGRYRELHDRQYARLLLGLLDALGAGAGRFAADVDDVAAGPMSARWADAFGAGYRDRYDAAESVRDLMDEAPTRVGGDEPDPLPERVRAAGCDIPVIPGIMPITNYSTLARFSDACGAEIPRWVRKQLEAYGDDMQSIQAFGEQVITEMCQKLLAGGAPGLHFYTLNQAEPSLAIWNNLGLSR